MFLTKHFSCHFQCVIFSIEIILPIYIVIIKNRDRPHNFYTFYVEKCDYERNNSNISRSIWCFLLNIILNECLQ